MTSINIAKSSRRDLPIKFQTGANKQTYNSSRKNERERTSKRKKKNTSKETSRAAHHTFLENSHPEVTKNPYCVLSPDESQKKL